MGVVCVGVGTLDCCPSCTPPSCASATGAVSLPFSDTNTSGCSSVVVTSTPLSPSDPLRVLEGGVGFNAFSKAVNSVVF